MGNALTILLKIPRAQLQSLKQLTLSCMIIIFTFPASLALENEKPVMFVHVSNSAGTALCRSFVKSGIRTPGIKSNCNARCSLPWNWQRFCSTKVKCQKIKCTPPWGNSIKNICYNMNRYAENNQIQMLGREMFLEEVDRRSNFSLCVQFRYFLIFKEPIARISSNLARLSKHPNIDVKKWLKSTHATKPNLIRNQLNDMSGTPSLNNYVTRLLLGEEAFFLGKSQMNFTTMKQHALQVLNQFDLVVPAEELSSPKSIELISNLFLKNTQLRDSLSKFLIQRMNHKKRKSSLDSEAMQTLKEANEIDIQLYELMKVKFKKIQSQLSA